MISLKLLIYLSIGTAAMLVPIAIQTKWHNIVLWKSIPIAMLLTVSGTVGTYLLFFIENHWIGGTSFYGAVFFVPMVFPLIAKLMNEKYEDLLDVCAPAECIMLVIMKIQCQISGCCAGRDIFLPWNQSTIQFPSQMAELINALVIFAVLMFLSRRKQNRGNLYQWYMIIYGCTRFILNFFRAGNSVFAMGLSAGSFWSVWSVLFGSIGLLVWYRKKKVVKNRKTSNSC